MPQNYQKGRRFEYEIVKKLKKMYPEGFFGRNAGSHGFFDVWGIVPRDVWSNHYYEGSLHLIQAKTTDTKAPTKAHEKEWQDMKLIQIPKILVVRKEFWWKGKNGHIVAWGED